MMETTLSKGQKEALFYLLASKTFERLAFYMLTAVLITFMADSLKLSNTTISLYYSIFYAVIAVMTIAGGVIGDFRGRPKVVFTGLLLVAIMYLAMALVPGSAGLVLVALVFLGFGIGLASPNIVVLLGNIYNEKGVETRGLPGFILLTLVTNIGAFVSPFVAVSLRSGAGYPYIFVTAFASGVLSLFLFSRFGASYRRLNLVAEQKDYLPESKVKGLHKKIVYTMFAVAVLVRFALGQKGATMRQAMGDFVEKSVTLRIFIDNYQVVLSLILMLAFIIFLLFYSRQSWSGIFGILIAGIAVGAVAYLLVAGFSYLSPLLGKELLFATAFGLIIVAETLILPVITYSIYRSSPAKHKGLFQGIAFLVIGLGGSLLALGFLLYSWNAVFAFVTFAIVFIIAVFLILYLLRCVKRI